MKRSVAILVGALVVGGLASPAGAQYGYMPAPYYPCNPYAVPNYVPGYVPYPGPQMAPQVPLMPVENWNAGAPVPLIPVGQQGAPWMAPAVSGAEANPASAPAAHAAKAGDAAKAEGEGKGLFKLTSRCRDGNCGTASVSAASSCDASCCAPPCHDPCSDPCGRAGGFYAGGGVFYGEAVWENNPAFILTQTAGANTFASQIDFSYDWHASPRVWIGFATAGGLGVRGRGWYYSQTEDTSTATPAGGTLLLAAPLGISDAIAAGGSAQARSLLHLYEADLEFTLELLRDGRWSLLASAGVRYVHLSQRYDVTEFNAAGASTDLLLSGHRYDGEGPTVGLEAQRQIGDSNFALFANTRGSALFGRGRQGVLFFNNAAGSIAAASISQERIMPIMELEAGIEWGYDLGNVRLVAQTGAAAQVWFNAGNSSDSSASQADLNSRSRANLGFFGVTGMFGFRY